MPLSRDQQEIVAQHVGLAHTEARRYAAHSAGRMSYEDALSAGLLGLVQAAEAYPAYCARHGYDPSRLDFFRVYASQRIRGAVLDESRQRDHMSRADRRKVKTMRLAENTGTRDLAGQAEAAGVTVKRAGQLQANALMSISLDEPGPGNIGDGLVAVGADVEILAAVRETLRAVTSAFDALPHDQQVLVALVFHQEEDITAAAKLTGLSLDIATRKLGKAVGTVHQAMLRAVSEGSGAPMAPEAARPAKAAPPQPEAAPRLVVRRLRSADNARARERATPPAARAREDAAAAGRKFCPECLAYLPIEDFNWSNRALGKRMYICRTHDQARQYRSRMLRQARISTV